MPLRAIPLRFILNPIIRKADFESAVPAACGSENTAFPSTAQLFKPFRNRLSPGPIATPMQDQVLTEEASGC